MAAHSNSSSAVEETHENAIHTIPPDARVSTQHGSTYSGVNRTKYGNIIQVNSINAYSVRIGTTEQPPDDLKWLYTPHYDSRHKKIKRERVKDSGAWLFERKEYQKWYDDPGLNRLLWCHGKPRAGKTFITSAVIDKLLDEQKELDTAIAYIYLDYADRETQTLENVFASVLNQISRRKKEAIEEIHGKCGKGPQRPDADALVEALTRMPQHFEKIFIIIDALDECSDKLRNMLLKQLRCLDDSKWRLFLTGRSHLSDIPTKFPSCLRVTVFAHRDDVKQLVRERIHDQAGLAELFEDNPLLEDEAISKIVERANGSRFLLVTLMLNSIASSTCENDIEESLDQMSVDLNQSYEKTLERIKDQDAKKVELACRILWWLSRAQRPLSCNELPQAVAVRNGDRGRNTKKESKPGIMTAVCMGLVFVDDAENFRLVHFSTQEYLRAHFSLSNATKILREHEIIASACLTILLYDEFEEGLCHCLSDYEARSNKHPMLSYAARYWNEHLGESISEEMNDLALNFLRSPYKFKAYIQARGLQKFPGLLRWYTTSDFSQHTYTTALHMVSEFGWAHLLEQLLQEPGIDINAVDHLGETLLTVAIRKGHTRIVELLLRAEMIDCELQDKWGKTPFLIAVGDSNVEIVKQLLAKGVAVQARDKEQNNALHIAANYHSDNAQMAELLIAVGVEINARNNQDQTPLHTGVRYGAREVVHILLSRGADISAVDDRGCTLLQLAIEMNRLDLVQALHLAGVDLHARTNGIYTALGLALEQDKPDIVDWLLSLDTKSPGRDEHTLHVAAASGALLTVKMLLSKGVEGDPHYKFSGDALQALCFGRHRNALQLLLDDRAAIDQSSRFSGFSFFSAACRGHFVTLHLLAERNAACFDLVDEWGRNALHFAARGGHEGCFMFLLSKGLDLNSIDVKGNTVLHYAAAGGSFAIVKYLLDHDATSASGLSGIWSPLYWAYRSASRGVVNLLKAVYSEEDVVETVHPAGLWTPLAIGLYHCNQSSSQQCLISSDRTGAWHDIYYCKECFLVNIHKTPYSPRYADKLQDIYGPRFHCLSCIDFDVCFMCKLNVAKSHPLHRWKVFEWRQGKSVEVESAEL